MSNIVVLDEHNSALVTHQSAVVTLRCSHYTTVKQGRVLKLYRGVSVTPHKGVYFVTPQMGC